MWAGVAGVVFVLLAGLSRGAGYSAYYEYYQMDPGYEDDDDDGDFYALYGEVDTDATLMTDPMDTRAFTRIRRYGDHDVRSIDPQELRYVKGALKDILSGHDLDSLEDSNESLEQDETSKTTSPTAKRRVIPHLGRQGQELRNDPSPTIPDFGIPIGPPGGGGVGNMTPPSFPPGIGGQGNMTIPPLTPGVGGVGNMTPPSFPPGIGGQGNMTIPPLPPGVGGVGNMTPPSFPPGIGGQGNMTIPPLTPGNGGKKGKTTTTRKKNTANVTLGPPGPKMDINAIIAIIANLTYDYEWNLTEEFNKTLIEHGVPTCPSETTLSTTSTTPSPYDFANTSVVGKCFVCGLKAAEIPRNAFCADAFAGDFLPLVPVDPRARGHIATYRKYCRHLDVHNYVENPSEPRSIYGRFTGGCGVRWTDLTGIYTQRTCRAKTRPLMGKHFASKRMAKLELALIHVENGCIISPMATLLPLSRGVSLYARFHACVCTGSWCNRAARAQPALYAALACWLAHTA